MADYGLRISRDGFDAKTCDDKDLVLTSKLNSFKASVGLREATTLLCPKNFAVATKEITHDYGYRPPAEVWYEDENGLWRSHGSSHFTISPAHELYDYAGAYYGAIIWNDKLEIRMTNRNVTTDQTANLFYIIFDENLA